MSSKLTYLSNYSLAVHETVLIYEFECLQKRRNVQQALTVFLICGGFITIASLALVIPIFLQGFLRSMLLQF